MRRLTSAPKPSLRECGVHRLQAVGRGRRAIAVLHAVVARQVRARLGGAHQVVGRARRTARAAARCPRACAPAPRMHRERGVEGGLHVRVHAFATRTCRGTPTRRPLTSPVSAAATSGTRLVRRGGVGAIGAGDHRQRQRRVLDRARERADLIERRREGQQAVARHAAVGRLEPDDAAERRRLADRPAGVGAERERHLRRADGGRRAAARSARRARQRPGIAHRPERRVLVRRAHRELVAVGLADDHRAGGLEPLDDGGVVGRHVGVEDLRRRGGPHAAHAEVVLDRDRARRPAGPAPRRRRAARPPCRARAERARRRRRVESVQGRVRRASMRASASRHTSTADTRPAATSSRMARAVVAATSAANHARHAEEPGLDGRVGRVGHGLLRRERGPRLVVALGAGGGVHVRGGRHARRCPPPAAAAA